MTARILVACEFSGVVRRAFRARGFDAWSLDLLPAEDKSEYHIVGDLAAQINRDRFTDIKSWDLLIAFPPCTHLAVSGARWFAEKADQQRQAIEFFLQIAYAPFRHIAIENPIGIMSTRYRKPDQIIQPWQFGHGETKATCLWLKNLPLLTATNIVQGREARVHRMAPGPDRWKERSRTYPGIAEAMADQWGAVLRAPVEAR